jgi:hypothetical protein
MFPPQASWQSLPVSAKRDCGTSKGISKSKVIPRQVKNHEASNVKRDIGHSFF